MESRVAHTYKVSSGGDFKLAMLRRARVTIDLTETQRFVGRLLAG